jgi:hypothetical protein
MITPMELRERMQAQPFQPFRLCLTGGKTFDVTNHDMAWVIRGTIYENPSEIHQGHILTFNI